MSPSAPRILITDDDTDLRETLGELFRRRGMEVVLAEDGDRAIDVVTRLPIHVALLDLHMPRVSGLEVLEHFRSIESRPKCILMSGQLDELAVARALAAEVYRVEPKPFSVRRIEALVAAALADVQDCWTQN